MSINYICNRMVLSNEPSTFDSSVGVYNGIYSRYDIRMIEEEDVNDISDKYLLVYPLQEQISKKIKRDKNIISDKIVEKLKHGFDITIFFCTEAECEFENCYEVVNDFLNSKNLPNEKFYIVSGNSKLENIETYGIKTIKNFNPIINRISNTMGFKKPIDMVDWVENKKYLFQCHNNFGKPHRVAILSLLNNKKLLDNVDWSFMRTYDLYKNGETNTSVLIDIFGKEFVNNILDDLIIILNGGKSKYSEYENESMRNPNADGEPDHNITYEANPHKNAYINIVNESQFELKNTIHITEKSLIPFHFYQLPLFVATQGHVKKMKQLYGFDMFDDVIDHSYDFIENTNDRMLAILSEIERLNANEDFIREFYKSNKERFQKNTKIVESLSFINPYDCIIDEFLK